jgi:hypothetical protein
MKEAEILGQVAEKQRTPQQSMGILKPPFRQNSLHRVWVLEILDPSKRQGETNLLLTEAYQDEKGTEDGETHCNFP